MKIKKNISDIKLSIRKITDLAIDTPDCVRFDIGQPDFDTPFHIKEAAKKALDEKKTAYAPMVGIPELRKAIADAEKKNGLDFGPGNVMVTNGGMGALFNIFLGLCGKDDEIMIQDPYWAAYTTIFNSLELKFSAVPFIKDAKLDEKILLDSITEKTKFLLVNSPNNPTGEVLDEKSVKRIAEIAKDHGIIVVADEVYEKLLFNNRKHISIAKFYPEGTLKVGAVSKTYSMTGWRIGWLVAPDGVIDELKKCNRATASCINTFAQFGAVAALTGDQSCVQEMKDEYEKRYNVMKQRIGRLGWECPPVDGAFYMMPRTGRDSWTYAMDLIEKAGVATVPGEPFGRSTKYSLRFCFGSVGIDDINRGFDRIEAYEKKYGKKE